MDVQRYFQSLGQEVNSLKQRVRYLLANKHWLTDGEWKESVVRQVLRRHLPMTAVVSSGFVVTAEKATTQIDILVHDASKPVVFRDGDLVFVTPDSVLGLIEVKSCVGRSQFAKAIAKLSQDIAMVRLHPNSRAFAAFFAFETKGQLLKNCLIHIAKAAPTWNHRLDFGALGESGFIRYWSEDPANPIRSYESWHYYELSGLAAGYFVHNVVDAVSPQSVLRNNEVWFPTTGKEPHCKRVQRGRWNQEQNDTAMEPSAP